MSDNLNNKDKIKQTNAVEKKLDDVFRRSNLLHCNKALFWFDLAKDCNLALLFRKLIRKYDSMLFRALYYLVPLIIVYFNFAVNIFAGTFMRDDGSFTYLEDWGNSFCKNMFFLLTYLMSAYYSDKLDHSQIVIFTREFLAQKDEARVERKNAMKYNFPALLVALGAALGVTIFIISSKNMPGSSWLNELPRFFYFYFMVFSAICWSLFISLLLMVFEIAFITFYCANDKINEVFNYDIDKYDQNESVTELLNIIIVDFAFAVLYVGIAFLYGYCYFKAAEKSPGLAGIVSHGDFFIATGVALIIVILIYLYVPYKELCDSMNKRRFMRIEEYDKEIMKQKDMQEKEALIAKRTELMERRVNFSSGNIFTLITSVLIPCAGIILESFF